MGMSLEEYRNLIQNDFKTKNPYRQFQGKVNHAIGNDFEKQVESICEVYELNNLARIEKTPEPMKILRHIENGHFETVFTKSAQPDFKGTIKGGRTVVFDAKFTESDRIRFSALSDFQRETLLKYDGLGAISFVLVGFMNDNIYKVDIKTWNKMKEIFGRKYITQIELDELNLKAKTVSAGFIDFLGIV